MTIYKGDKFLNKKNQCIYEVAMLSSDSDTADTILVYGRSPFNEKALVFSSDIPTFLKTHTPLDKVEPCPFCGSEAEVIEKDMGSFEVGCTNDECFLAGGGGWSFDTRQEALDLWNRRSAKLSGSNIDLDVLEDVLLELLKENTGFIYHSGHCYGWAKDHDLCDMTTCEVCLESHQKEIVEDELTKILKRLGVTK